MVKLIGTPYAEMDCYDLAAAFYKEYFGISLRELSYSDASDKEEVDKVFNLAKMDFVKHEKPKLGDIIVFKSGKLASHIGIYIEKNRFLHTTIGPGAALDVLSNWKHKIIGYYRWQGSNIHS